MMNSTLRPDAQAFQPRRIRTPDITHFPSITFRPHREDSTMPDWEHILNEELSGIWLTSANRTHRNLPCTARGWTINLETRSNHVLALHPSQRDATGAMEVLCAPNCNKNDTSKALGFSTMIAESDVTIGRAAVAHTKVSDVLKTLEQSGVANYRLVNGRGKISMVCPRSRAARC